MSHRTPLLDGPGFDTDDQRWAAVRRRDGNADGAFFYSVRTTGVYCRPSCSARRPQRENVRFHDTAQRAEAAGFRPCLRCRPAGQTLSERRAATVTRVCRIIEAAEEPPSLESLARFAGLSPSHLHRIFKEVTGVTPRAYAAAHRAEQVREALARGGTVTDAIYEAGFGSSGRFYAKAREILGMTPKGYRSGGDGEVIRFAVGECALGSVLVAATHRGVCAVLLGDRPEPLVSDLQARFPSARLVGGDPKFETLVATVVGFVDAPTDDVGLPLHVRGTAFQHRVWRALREVPAGSTVSYAEVARRIGAPGAARAVAGACAANSLAVAIPCHRVVRTDGGLAGYRWGVERKRALLRREASP